MKGNNDPKEKMLEILQKLEQTIKPRNYNLMIYLTFDSIQQKFQLLLYNHVVLDIFYFGMVNNSSQLVSDDGATHSNKYSIHGNVYKIINESAIEKNNLLYE